MGQVTNLTIKAFKDNKFSSSVGEFRCAINPENLSIQSSIKYHAPSCQSNLLKYHYSPPRLLTFSLLFDDTGAIPQNAKSSVMNQIKKLQDITYDVQQGINSPYYLRIIWGEMDFTGRLIDIEFIYSMFKLDGTLVRAEATLSVLEVYYAKNTSSSTKPSPTSGRKSSSTKSKLPKSKP